MRKYLDQYAEIESRDLLEAFEQQPPLSGDSRPTYKGCIVVPVYNEAPDFITRLSTQNWDRSVLVIVVINQARSQIESQAEGHAAKAVQNIALDQWISEHGQRRWYSPQFALYTLNNIDILVVDRYTEGREIDASMGVGLARKIGCDIAAALMSVDLIDTPWIHSTDADAHLPEDYFSATEKLLSTPKSSKNSPTSAAVYEFSHTAVCAADHGDVSSPELEQEIARATLTYEQALRYYRAGLAWAGSPYAFYTLGSTLAFTVDAYTKVRGFPKRSGGEDFYLLNKLAKIGSVISLDSDISDTPTITLEPRLSDRVPFGTGPATGKIMALWAEQKEYTYYHPQVFSALQAWLNIVPQTTITVLGQARGQTSTSENLWQTLMTRLESELSVDVAAAGRSLGLESYLKHAAKQFATAKTAQQCAQIQKHINKSFHDWFDAFLTLKFIHYMQTHYYAPIPLTLALLESKTMFSLNAVE